MYFDMMLNIKYSTTWTYYNRTMPMKRIQHHISIVICPSGSIFDIQYHVKVPKAIFC
jgi:hypothetical protein